MFPIICRVLLDNFNSCRRGKRFLYIFLHLSLYFIYTTNEIFSCMHIDLYKKYLLLKTVIVFIQFIYYLLKPLNSKKDSLKVRI